jgi:hypothetical protein
LSKQKKSVIETHNLQDVFFGKQTQFSLGSNALDAPASNIDVLFSEIHVFLQHSLLGLSAANRLLHLESHKLQYVFLKE